MLAEGTHTIIMEKNRLQLFEAVQAFLDEAGRSPQVISRTLSEAVIAAGVRAGDTTAGVRVVVSSS